MLQAKEPQGSIDLTYAAVDNMGRLNDEDYAFFISTPQRLWRLAAANLLEMQEWIGCLREERRRALVRLGSH